MVKLINPKIHLNYKDAYSQKLCWISIFTNMNLPWVSKLLSFSFIIFSLPIYGQNTISVKKTSTTITAIYKSSSSETKLNQYYCFKKSGYVYYFTSSLKEKKIIRNCQEQQWLKMNSSPGTYFFYHDSISISPITYSIYGKETTTDFSYIGILDSVSLDVSAVEKQEKTRFKLLFPKPIIIQE